MNSIISSAHTFSYSRPFLPGPLPYGAAGERGLQKRRIRFAAAILLALLYIGTSLASAAEPTNWTGLKPYFTKDPKVADHGPPDKANSGWTPVAPASNLTVPHGGKIWFAFPNKEDKTKAKSFHIETELMTNSSSRLNDKYELTPSVEGFASDGTKVGKRSLGSSTPSDPRDDTDHPTRQGWNYRFFPQPAWEQVSYKNETIHDITLTNVQAWSLCATQSRNFDIVALYSAEFGDLGPTILGIEKRLREIRIFIKRFTIGFWEIGPVSFNAPPSTGNWTPRMETTDPNGNPRGAGISWVTDGPGLAAGQSFDLSFSVQGAPADWQYEMYALEAASGQYLSLTLDLSDDLKPHLKLRPDVDGGGVEFDAVAGLNYVVESSTDFAGWQPVAWLVGAGQPARIPCDVSQPRQFFRAQAEVDLTAPALVSASSSSAGDSIIVAFSKPIDPLRATDPRHYRPDSARFTPSVFSAFLRSPETVELLLNPPLASSGTNRMWVEGIIDVPGNIMVASATVITASSPETPCENGEWIESTVVERLCYPDGLFHLLQDSLYKCPDGRWRFYQVRNDTTADRCP